MLPFNYISIKGWIVGFGFSLVVGGIAIEYIMRWLRKKSINVPDTMKNKPDIYLVRILGFLERGLYTSCIIINQPAWIAAWLAIKVITRWADIKNRNVTISLANIYLIGNILTVIFGVAGGIISIKLK